MDVVPCFLLANVLRENSAGFIMDHSVAESWNFPLQFGRDSFAP